MNIRLRSAVALLLSILVFPVHAQPQDEEDLSLVYGDEDFVSIATGSRQSLARAPAIATVITADDIRYTGATDLDQILETVPGLHVSVSTIAYNPIYVMRGIYSQFNPQILMLINGTPITSLYVGDRGNVWGGMPVNGIARIEVIRGPGSAIYGADAFSGVINIVTKKKDDIDKTEIGVRRGSFNTQDAWLLHGTKYGKIDAAFSLELHTTDGQREIIDADAQSIFDGLLATSASLAPGPVSLERDTIDARLDLSSGHWQLRMGFQGRYNMGTGAGIAQALDPEGQVESERFLTDITYHNPNISQNWDLTTQLSYMNYNQQTNLILFPPGANLGTGVFADGIIGNPDVYERHYRFGVSAFYTGLDKHRIRLGSGVNRGDVYKVKETKNFSSNAAGTPVPLGVLVDVSDTSPFLRDEDRTNYYAFLQDEWSFVSDWDLTAGLRYDYYSDFGSTLNPRVALVWQTNYNTTTKLLYGRAFRAPSFAEEFNINNPVAIGNPNLDPETIDTLELAFNYQAKTGINTGLNLFYYEMKDIIRFIPDPAPATSSTAQNTGRQKGHGLEWETRWDINKKLNISGNYAFQESTDDETDNDAGNAPHHQFYARINWKFVSKWTLNTQLNRVVGRKRVSGDVREDIDDYTTVDLTLRRRHDGNRWWLAASVYNIFNEEVLEPSLNHPTLGALIPNDLPLPGRNYSIELSYGF